MAKAASHLATAYCTLVEALDQDRSRFEMLAQSGHLKAEDIRLIYESLFLRYYIEFELVIEELFVQLMCRKVRCSTSVQPRFQVTTPDNLLPVLSVGRGYVKWLPYDATIALSAACMQSREPFSRLTQPDTKLLENMACIRNAIAHRSRQAMNQFQNKILGGGNYKPHERLPGGFLRTTVSQDEQTQWEQYASHLKRMVKVLCT
jgi:hypothetical protein